MAGKKLSRGRATLADVANATGFSISTISVILNETPLSQNFPLQTKELIRTAAKRLGYRPHAFARSLRSRRSQIIGIMVFNIADPFCTQILNGIYETLQPTDYLPIIMDAHNDVQQFARYLEMLLERRVEGFIVIANWLFIDIKPLVDIEHEQIPTVLIGQEMHSGSISSVMVDNEVGGYIALKHLYELGHREIAIVRGPVQLPDSNKRWAGMKRFAREVKLKLRKEWILDLPDISDPSAGFEEGHRAVAELLKSKNKFTAVIAFDDLTALGAIRALRLAGLRVPEDCSVIGFDDVPNASFSSPTLTTVRQQMAQMGRMAAERVLKGIDAFNTEASFSGEHWLTTPEVIVRESTAMRRS